MGEVKDEAQAMTKAADAEMKEETEALPQWEEVMTKTINYELRRGVLGLVAVFTDGKAETEKKDDQPAKPVHPMEEKPEAKEDSEM